MLAAGCDSGGSSSSGTTTTAVTTTTLADTTTTTAPATTLPPTTTAAPTTTTVPPTTTTMAATTTVAPRPPQTTQPLTGRYVTDPTDDIRIGDSGPAVLQIQARLGAWGYILPIDGSYGITTEQQVTAFQRDHGLKADGISGRNTWFALAAEPPA
jgi:peptidoglycan hydrolase-like protein with peptidoglycan-binding domain